MKTTIRKLLAVMTALIMTLALAACGGSSGGGESSASAEPNAGLKNIVFSVPDGWTLTAAGTGSYAEFDTGSEYGLFVSTFDEDDVKWNQENDVEDTAGSVQEQFEKINSSTDEELAKDDAERSTLTVCDTDAYHYTYSKDGKCTGLSVNFLKDDVLYYVTLGNSDNYDDEGNFKSDFTAATDEEQAAFESVVGSITDGDGEALLASLMNIDSIGNFTFEIPEGYTITSFSDGYLNLSKDGSDSITIGAYTIVEDDLKWYTDEDGNAPESIEAEYATLTEWMEDSEKATIAGYDGYKYSYPAEDGNYYSNEAIFLADGVIYQLSLLSDAWDYDGNIKEGAEPLTDDDLAAFDAFVASMKAK